MIDLGKPFFKKHHHVRNFFEIVIHTYKEWRNDNTLRLGAGIAYYGIIALIPLLVVAIGIAEVFFSSSEISQFLGDAIESVFGTRAAEIIPDIEEHIDSPSFENFYNVGLIGFAALLFSASLIFLALQDALNVIWKTQKGLQLSLHRYIMSFSVTLFFGTSMTLVLATHALLRFAQQLLPDQLEAIPNFTGFIGTSTVIVVMFITIIFVLRSFITVKLSVRDLVLSSATIAAFMYLGVFALTFYFSNFASKSLYGALAGFILVLVAIYYYAQIFLAGAELSKVISYRNGNQHLQKYLKKTDPRAQS